MFESREDAGERLGQQLLTKGIQVDMILGLPRGGVVVAARMAQILNVALDVLVVRKIGHPWQREFALGALAEGGVVVLDASVLGLNPSLRKDLEQVIIEEQDRLEEYRSKFHRLEAVNLLGKRVALVDDGIATGATAEAAVLSARNFRAAWILVAAPVASVSAVRRLRELADEVIVLHVDPLFDAVGRYYAAFAQTTDLEVTELLRAA